MLCFSYDTKNDAQIQLRKKKKTKSKNLLPTQQTLEATNSCLQTSSSQSLSNVKSVSSSADDNNIAIPSTRNQSTSVSNFSCLNASNNNVNKINHNHIQTYFYRMHKILGCLFQSRPCLKFVKHFLCILLC